MLVLVPMPAHTHTHTFRSSSTLNFNPQRVYMTTTAATTITRSTPPPITQQLTPALSKMHREFCSGFPCPFAARKYAAQMRCLPSASLPERWIFFEQSCRSNGRRIFINGCYAYTTYTRSRTHTHTHPKTCSPDPKGSTIFGTNGFYG